MGNADRHGAAGRADPHRFPLVVIPNFGRRFTGVSATVERLVPILARSVNLVVVGYELNYGDLRMPLPQLLRFLWRQNDQTTRVWHARRHTEMLAGILVRAFVGRQWKLVFTSASQRPRSTFAKYLLRQIDIVIATSEASASLLERVHAIIPHGIDCARFRPKDKGAVRQELHLPDVELVGCVGRIRPLKGVDVFVLAMLRLMSKDPKVVAVVAGDARPRNTAFLNRLKAMIANAGHQDRFLWLGEVPQHLMPDLFSALDVYVAPQRYEGFGLTPLEAMACGVPVVATSVGTFPLQVEDGVCGYVVPPGNDEVIAEKVRSLIDDESFRAQAGLAGRTRVCERFGIEAEATAIGNIYTKLIRGEDIPALRRKTIGR